MVKDCQHNLECPFAPVSNRSRRRMAPPAQTALGEVGVHLPKYAAKQNSRFSTSLTPNSL